MSENPPTTEQRILSAARAEFAAHGFAGARVERIARAADCNKQLIYHYFGNKEGLSRAVFHDMLVTHRTRFSEAPTDVDEFIARAFDHLAGDPDWVRMILWERLTLPSLIYPEARREQFESILPYFEFVEPAEMRRHVALVCMSMAIFPWIAPTLTELIVEQPSESEEFRRNYTDALRWVMRRVRGGPDQGNEP